MTIQVQIVGRDEAAILSNLAPGVFDDPLHGEATAEFLADERHHIAVAIDDGEVVGFASAVHYVHPDKPRAELWINEVAVAPTHEGRGIGKRILRCLLEHAEKLGCAEAWVLTDRSNERAMRLYASLEGVEAPSDAVMFTFFLP